MGSLEFAQDILTNPRHTKWISLLLLAGEAALCALIILRVPYTEIDWSTYMQHIELIFKGERDYTKIQGDTGPLVYPGLHVYIYAALYYATDHGTNIQKAQCIFAILYLLSLSVVFSCYRRAGAPPYLLAPLVLSKRLHSIFLLRLFNDAWSALGLWLAIYFFQRRNWALGALAWSAGVGVKMTAVLALPAVAVVVLQGAGRQRGLIIGAIAAQLQVAIGLPFILEGPARSYFSRAFQLDRQFLYKWTVNWKMMTEELFLSRGFSLFLLAYHLLVVLLFLNDRWLRPSSNNVIHGLRQYLRVLPEGREMQISQKVSPMFVMESMLGSIVIGLMCARTLHYQFYVYLGWATPFLLWRIGVRPGMIYFIWAAQELSWLVYPSTSRSSSVVVGCLALQVLGVWFATSVDASNIVEGKDEANDKEDSKLHVE